MCANLVPDVVVVWVVVEAGVAVVVVDAGKIDVFDT